MITQTFFQGFFDADGSIQVFLKQTTKSKQLFNCYILFKIKKILKENLPLNPSKRKDFLIALHLHNLIKKKQHLTVKTKLYMLYLIYKMLNQVSKSTVIKRKPISNWLNQININRSTKLKVEKKVYLFNKWFINANLKKLLKTLPTTILCNDYIRGVHCGDGSLTVVLSWSKAFICRPTWTITDSNQTYLKAFLYTLKRGRLKSVGPKKNNCFQYTIENVKPCIEKVVPIFESKWLPYYKKTQYFRFKQACCLLYCNYIKDEKWFII